MNKESYMDKYEEFIEQVGSEHTNYTNEDWETVNQKFNKFSEEWKTKFKDEFSWKDEMVLSKHELKFLFYSSKKEIKGLIKELFLDDLTKLKEELKYYSENDMEEEILFLVEQAKDMEETIYNGVLELLKELDIELEKLNKDE